MTTKRLGINSRLVHGGYHPDGTGAVNVPIYQTSTFAFRDVAHGAALFAGEEDGYIYTRIGNPTIRALEDAVADLENGVGGVATSSGLGAVSTLYMTLLGEGAHLVSTASVYGPSRGLIENSACAYSCCALVRKKKPRIGILPSHGTELVRFAVWRV